MKITHSCEIRFNWFYENYFSFFSEYFSDFFQNSLCTNVSSWWWKSPSWACYLRLLWAVLLNKTEHLPVLSLSVTTCIFREQGHTHTKVLCISSPLAVMINRLSCNNFTYMWYLESRAWIQSLLSICGSYRHHRRVAWKKDGRFFDLCSYIIQYLYPGSEDTLLFITVGKCTEGDCKWQL